MTERRAPELQPWGHEAIRAGRKTMTRRVMKPQPPLGATEVQAEDLYGEIVATYRAYPNGGSARHAVCGSPHGRPGDTWALKEPLCLHPDREKRIAAHLDGTPVLDRRTQGHGELDHHLAWRWQRDTLPSMFMPLYAARDFVTLEAVRVERLQAISETDAIAEGIRWQQHEDEGGHWEVDVPRGTPGATSGLLQTDDPIEAFAYLWDSINAKPKPVYRQCAVGVGKRSVRTARLIDHWVSYPWQDIQETRERRGKPWYVWGNPYVWCYTFGGYTREPGRPLQEKRA